MAPRRAERSRAAVDLRRFDLLRLAGSALLLIVLGGVVVNAPEVDLRTRLTTLAVLLACAAAALELRRRFWISLDAELERCKLAEQTARAADRAKGRFVANLSHEIRAPMQGILGMSDLLLRSDLTAQQREQVELVRTSAQALLTLAEDILDLARVDAGRLRLRPRDFALRALLDDVARLLAPRAGRREVELGLEVDDALPDSFRGDPVRLRQVLLNLVGNAVRFTRRGSVTVRVEPAGDAARGDGALDLRFVVRDTGVGIRPQDQARLFEPFTQGGSSSSGTVGGSGLGLVISKNLVELMGGEIGFESTRGTGSTFWFRVPLEPARGGASEPALASQVGDVDRRLARADRRVLAVDDRSVNRTVVLALLADLGYAGEAAAGGEEALAMLAERGYDALLLDCEMPGVDGFEICRRWRRREEASGAPRRLPVIAVTAHTRPEDTERCHAAGMDDHLGKPFRTAELAAVLDRWTGVAAPASAGDHLESRTAALRRQDARSAASTLATFLQRGEDDVETVRRALERADPDAAAAAAHALAGSAGLLGAGELAARAAELAGLARRGDLDGCRRRLPALQTAWRRTAGRLRS